jgi:hypothetical protein
MTKIVVRKCDGNRRLWKYRHIWENNVMTDISYTYSSKDELD